MRTWLFIIIVMVMACVTINPAIAFQERAVPEKGYAIKSPFLVIYKTEEEIAWELLRYAIMNMPSLRFRINQYEDLLEAYRKALNVIKEPRKSIPDYQER